MGSIPGYPNLGTDLNGKPLPPLSKGYSTPASKLGKIDPLTGKPAQWTRDLGVQTGTPTTATQIRAMQQFLKNRGYNISVDGIRGPETNAAVAAFHNHVSPMQYNAKNSKSTASTPTATTPVLTTPPKTAPKPAPKAASPKTNVPPPTAPSFTNDPLIDPTAYATGLVNAEYGPQIAELLNQVNQSKNQATQDQTDITNWYNQLLKVAGQTGADNASIGQAAIGSYNDASNTALSQLFGGAGASPSADEAAAFHDINSGALTGNVEDQAVFDKNLLATLAGSGVEARTSQGNKDRAATANLLSQLLQLKGAKGQAYTSAYQTGLQNRTQQKAAQQSASLAASLAPSQIATANANANIATANALTAPAIAAANLKKANAVAAAYVAKANNGTWDLSVPAQRGALQQSFETNVLGPNGGLKMDPVTAWSNLQLQLNSAGLTNNTQAKDIMKAVFLQGLHTAHSQGRLGGFAWNGSKVVKTGNKYVMQNGKRVLVNSRGQVIKDYVPKS